jgi:hypothetical protein
LVDTGVFGALVAAAVLELPECAALTMGRFGLAVATAVFGLAGMVAPLVAALGGSVLALVDCLVDDNME